MEPNKKKCVNKNVFKKINYETRNIDVFSPNMITDCILTKKHFDSFCFSFHPPLEIKGFIQSISLEPFGFVLMSEIQVNINYFY